METSVYMCVFRRGTLIGQTNWLELTGPFTKYTKYRYRRKLALIVANGCVAYSVLDLIITLTLMFSSRFIYACITLHQVGNKVKDCSFSTVLSAFSCSKISLLYQPLKRFTTDWPQVLMPSKMTSGVSFKFSALMKCWPQVWIFTPKVQIFSLWVLSIVFTKQFITMITLWVLMHHLLMFLIRMTDFSQVKQNLRFS